MPERRRQHAHDAGNTGDRSADGRNNYLLMVMQNDTYETTGNQAIPGAGRINFAALALGAGFRRVRSIENAAEYEALLPDMLAAEGPVFAAVKVRPGMEGLISRSEREMPVYLKVSLADSGPRLKRALGLPPEAK